MKGEGNIPQELLEAVNTSTFRSECGFQIKVTKNGQHFEILPMSTEHYHYKWACHVPVSSNGMGCRRLSFALYSLFSLLFLPLSQKLLSYIAEAAMMRMTLELATPSPSYRSLVSLISLSTSIASWVHRMNTNFCVRFGLTAKSRPSHRAVIPRILLEYDTLLSPKAARSSFNTSCLCHHSVWSTFLV